MKLKRALLASDDRWLTMKRAAEHLGYDGPHAAECARQFCRRHDLQLRRRGGRALLVKQSTLDDFLEHGAVAR